MLINFGDIADGALVDAIALAGRPGQHGGGRLRGGSTSRRRTED